MRAGTLAASIAAQLDAHRGQSAVRLLPDGLDAFTLRMHSARLAQTSLDVQTYIWRDDETGRFIAHELILAADRGVDVRVLLDDMDARPRDLALEALDAHPHISVRMFNPFRTRSGLLRTLAEVSQRGNRLNHRMHNKTWIVDRQAAIAGGRNLGNEYFSSANDVNFIDLDVLMLGPAVDEATREFERYWRCNLSVPIVRLRKYMHKKLMPKSFRSRLERSVRQNESSEHVRKLREQDALHALLEGPFVWSANVRLIADDPRKALGETDALYSHVLDSVAREIRAATRELLLISPYFIPGIGGTAALRSFALQGGTVEILTNSLAATDVAIVHSGYAKYRKPLLEAGVRIFEMKSALTLEDGGAPFRLGSSRASLHTKAAIIDAERVFVGSFNIDPRSAELNCEMGVWIRSRQLAQEMTHSFRVGTDAQRSYAVSSEDGRIEWLEQTNGNVVRHDREPHASWIRRTIVRILEMLPIESQL